jgi:predicted DNA-binding transcriptional regulator AlpA
MRDKDNTKHDNSEDGFRGDWLQRERDGATLAEATRPVRLIDKRELLSRVGLSYPTVWKKMKAGTFPTPFVVGGKNMWRESEVEAWCASLHRRECYISSARVGRKRGRHE